MENFGDLKLMQQLQEEDCEQSITIIEKNYDWEIQIFFILEKNLNNMKSSNLIWVGIVWVASTIWIVLIEQFKKVILNPRMNWTRKRGRKTEGEGERKRDEERDYELPM